LYASDLNELVKPLQEAKKANALFQDFIPDIAEIEGKKVLMENPSPDVTSTKSSVLADMYKKEEYQTDELVHSKVLNTLVDGKKLANQQDTFAEVKHVLKDFNAVRVQYSNPLKLQLGMGIGKALTSSITAGYNAGVDATVAATIGAMVHSTNVVALQFVGGFMGVLYNLQKFGGGIINTATARGMYAFTNKNIYKEAGFTQAAAIYESLAELQAGMSAFKTIGNTFAAAVRAVPQGGHPMTARHSGNLEAIFKASSKQFKEGSLGYSSLNTFGKWLGVGQKAYATPISFLDSLMTIHTAKVKSRAAVLRNVMISQEYKELNLTPGTKEWSQYVNGKVDEVMPKDYFVWNKDTNASTHAVTYTEPLPKVLRANENAWEVIKREGVARTFFGLTDEIAQVGAAIAPPLRPYFTLFSTVAGNVLNQSLGVVGSRDGMVLGKTLSGDGTLNFSSWAENYYSKLADKDTYEAMAFSAGNVALGLTALGGAWLFAEQHKDWLTKKGNFLLNEEDDFPGIRLLQQSLGYEYNPLTGGYDTATKVRVGDSLTVNLSQIPLPFLLPAINFYRDITLVNEGYSEQLNSNVDTSGNVLAALDAEKEAGYGLAMQNFFRSVLPLDSAKDLKETGKNLLTDTMKLHIQLNDLYNVFSGNRGNEDLYDPITNVALGMADPLTQELLLHGLASKVFPQLQEISVTSLKLDTHSAKDLKIYEAASILKTGTSMDTLIHYPGVYSATGDPRVATRSAFVEQKPGASADVGIQELDRLNKRYPLSKLADNLVFNLHPMGGGSVQPSHTVWGGIKGINGSHIVAATLRNYRLGNNSDPRSALYPYNGKTLPQALRILINSEAYRNAPDAYLDDKKVLGNPDESRERESKVTMVKTLFNVYHERINDLLSSDPSLFVIESSNSKGTSLRPITEVEKDPGVDNRPKGLNTVQPVPQQQIDDFTNKLINNTKSVL
jgi:hypothetical protein